MSVMGTQTETLLTGLSSFWQTMFADRDQLNALYAGTETLLGQAYLDLLTEVLNSNLEEIPIFNKEYWHLLVLREDKLRFDAALPAPYVYDVSEPLVAFEFMLNRIYNPNVVWENGIDFEVKPAQICFYENPFEDDLFGVATRQVDIVPTVYQHGIDATLVSSTVLEFRGISHRGINGETFGTDIFRDTSGNFSPEDVGREIEILTPGSGEVRTILGLKDTVTVKLSAAIGSTGGTGVRWRVLVDKLFSTLDIGTQLVLEDPADAGQTHTHKIKSIVSPLSVEVTQEVDLMVNPTQSLAWAHQSAQDVTEISFWLPDAMFDRENLYLSFGYLINRHEPSSESYRALIQGIFQYFMLGPALQRTEAALNIMVGIPVARQDGEVVQSITPTQVLTDHTTYDLPAGSVREDLVLGATLKAFEPLTSVFTVTDYVEDPFWHYGKVIPKDLTTGAVLDRGVDPNPRDMVLGAPGWHIGDPRTYVGADFNGEPVPTLKGKFALLEKGIIVNPNPPPFTAYPGVLPSVGFLGTKLPENIVGRTLMLAGHPFEVTGVSLTAGTDGQADINVPSDMDFQDFWQTHQTLPLGEVVQDGLPIIKYPGAAFDSSRDTGCLLLVIPGTSTGIEGLWTIVQVLDPATVRLEPHTLVAGPPVFVQGTQIESQKTLNWEIVARPPLIHNLGYNLMQDYLRTHICYVSYALNKYDIPHPRMRADIQDVLLEGKPAHVYLMLSPSNLVEDTVRVGQEGFDLRLAPTETFAEVDAALTVDGTWDIGEYYQYTGPDVSWTNVVRASDAGTQLLLGFIQDAAALHLRAHTDGAPGATVFVTVYEDPGSAVVYAGALEEGGVATIPIGSNNLYVELDPAAQGEVISLDVGYTGESPGVHVQTAAIVTSSTGIGSGDGFFEDPSFFFTSFDEGRELTVETPSGSVAGRVAMVMDEHTVSLYDIATGLGAEVPTGSGYVWWFGAPRQFTTPVAVGGANHHVDRGTLVSWPLCVTFKDTGTIGAPGPLLIGPPGPTI